MDTVSALAVEFLVKNNCIGKGVKYFYSGMARYSSPYGRQGNIYICSIERDILDREQPTKLVDSDKIEVDLWWNPESEQVLEVDSGTGKKIRDLGNPLKEVPQREMTLEEITSGKPFMLPDGLRVENDPSFSMDFYYDDSPAVFLKVLGIQVKPPEAVIQIGIEEIVENKILFYLRMTTIEDLQRMQSGKKKGVL